MRNHSGQKLCRLSGQRQSRGFVDPLTSPRLHCVVMLPHQGLLVSALPPIDDEVWPVGLNIANPSLTCFADAVLPSISGSGKIESSYEYLRTNRRVGTEVFAA